MSKERRFAGLFLIVWLLVAIGLSGCQEENVEEIVIEAEEQEEEIASEEKETKEEVICVYVCGAVNNPGVYELQEGSRVVHALKAAGGLTEHASEESLNQARVLTDGEMIQVLTKEEMSASAVVDSSTKDGKVNINTADASELTSLNGIGETRAKAILDYREEHGNFQRIEDICNVDGIGESTFKKIQDGITVN